MDGRTQGAPGSNIETLPLAARRHAVVTQVARALAGPCGVPHMSDIVVGVSGGVDSTSLLLALAALRDRSESYQPTIVHVNHALRSDAGQDEVFVTDLAARFGLPCRSITVRPGLERGNTLANARRLRYAALSDIARDIGAAAIATAHHADDQFETMLMALSRGAGLVGLRGMKRRRCLKTGVALVRPLLSVRKEQLVDFCRCAGVTWREDSSNIDRSRSRARLRAEVLPVLDSLWPGAAGRAADVSDSLALAARLLRREVRRKFGIQPATIWPRSDLAGIPPVLIETGLRTAVREQLARSGGWSRAADATPRRVWSQVAEAIIDDRRHARQFLVCPGWVVRVDAETVRLSCIASNETTASSDPREFAD